MPPHVESIRDGVRERSRSRRLRRLIRDGRSRQPESRARQPWPVGLIGCALLIVVSESMVARHALDWTPTVTASWGLSGEAARGAAATQDVLAFGDSLIKHGLQPKVVEDRLGLKAYNLGVPAAPAPVSYFLLRRALDAGATPEAIVVDFAPDILAGGPVESLRNWPELLATREWLELAWDDGDAGFLVRSAIDRLFPSVRARFELQAGILAALDGETASQRELTLDHKDHWVRNQGGHLAPKNPLFQGEVVEEELRRLMAHGFRCHDVNALYLAKFCRLTRAREIPVYWLLPPVSPALQARRDASGAEDQFTRFVRSFLDENPQITVLDARWSGYDHGVFVDARHLDRDGALTLSHDLAATIERHRAGVPCPSWVVLPPYRPLSTALPLEDITQRIQARRSSGVGGG